MNRLSILLIENQIVVTANIVQVIGEVLGSYELTIVKDIAEAVAKPKPVDLILLNLAQLSAQVSAELSPLTAAYPDTPVILLQEPGGHEQEEEILIQALAAGASEYVLLSKSGLVVLGRRLEALLGPGLNETAPAEIQGQLPLAEIFNNILDNDLAQLAVQVIDPDNRVRFWNQAAENLFGLKREKVIGCLLDELPLSPANLGRLKDILDQARVTREPFSIATYPIEDHPKQNRWGRIYVYPLLKPSSRSKAIEVGDVCIIAVEITDLKQLEIKNWRYNQELQILLEISREITSNLELEPTLEKVAEQTKTLLNADNCYIYLLERNKQTLWPALSIGPRSDRVKEKPVTMGEGFIGSVAATNQTTMINFAAPPEGAEGDLYSAIPLKNEHLLGAPLAALNSRIGVMAVSRSRHAPFTQEDLHFFESLVQQASSAINNARLFEEIERNLNEIAILYEASATISTTWHIQEVLDTLIRQMVQAMAVSRGHIVSWDQNQSKGTIQAKFISEEITFPIDEQALNLTFNPAQRPILLTIVRQQRPVFFQQNAPALNEGERKDMEKYGCLSRLLIPLIVKGETIGWAELWETRQERVFTADEVRLARMLANQAAVAMENARYLKQTQQTLEETTALYQVASALTTTQDSQTIMSIVLQEYLRVLGLKQGSIVIFDFETKVGINKVNLQDEAVSISPAEEPGELPHRGLEGQQIPLRNNLIYEQLMRTRQPVMVKEQRLTGLTAPVSADIQQGWASPEALSLLIIPIQIRGEITGGIVIESLDPAREFEQWEISLGQAMADQLSIALQNVQLYELEYQRRQQAETLREVSFIVGSSLNLHEVLERILDQLGRVVQYDSAAIHLIEGNQRRIIAGRGFPHPEQIIGLSFPIELDHSEPGSIAIHTRQPLVIGNIQELYKIFREPPHNHIRSWLGIPLIARDKVIGLISIDHTTPNIYREEEVNLALAFANQVAIALENARLYEIEVRELERELEIAQGIQESLLPQVVPYVSGLEISGRILPARQIGGDFFHFFFLGKDQFGLAIGDVSGKGIPAALYMAVIMTAIDSQIVDHPKPGDLLNKLHQILYNRLQENKMNVGLQVATFAVDPSSADSQEKMMTLANAGMVAPIIATKEGCYILPVSGLPIGAPLEELWYEENEVALNSSMAVIFTSDGIVEARNAKGELFGFERLEETICAVFHTQQAETIAEHIIHTAQEFTGQAEQNDDMTVLVVIVKK